MFSLEVTRGKMEIDRVYVLSIGENLDNSNLCSQIVEGLGQRWADRGRPIKLQS